jgi:spore maturation protein CgeB
MTGQEPTEDRIKRLEKEILELKEAKDAVSRREEALIKKLKEYENAFYKELNAQVQVYRKSWTWRIGRLVVDPAAWLLNLFRSKKKVDGFKNEFNDTTKENIAVIFDTFTHSCFRPEFNTIRFSPANWVSILDPVAIKGLIIESAWNGNDGTWAGKIANLEGTNDSQLVKLIQWAKDRHIPTVFWNKEDPVHFDQFIEAAMHCEHIFTTDAGCVDAYRKKAPGAKVDTLPFAAQPEIHNPIASEGRTGSVCFAGTYYGHRYHERKNDMDFLLKPALDYGLEIYDRHFGDTSKYAENLRFPEIYRDATKGKLEYREMLKAYRRYKAFLNVNSVRYSTTMFARRVFELLACGTPVISNYSEGIINLLGEGTVLISESEEDTRKYLDLLLHDELFWWKTSLNGMRIVMNHHTYSERTRSIYQAIGLEYQEKNQIKFTLVSMADSMKEVRYLEKMIRRQYFAGFNVALISENERFDPDQIREIKSLMLPFPVIIMHSGDDNLEKNIAESSDSSHISFINAGKYYGPNYLTDFALALKYADPDVMGKNSIWKLDNGNRLVASNSGNEYRYVTRITGAASVHRKNKADLSRILDYARNEAVIDESARILSIDPFNFLDSDTPLNEMIFDNPLLKNIDL